MVELTIGYVAGIIAAVTTLVRLWSPNTLVYVLSGVLGDKNTAVTWSVAGRAIQNSMWPDILRSDTTLTHGVRWDVRILVKSIQLMKLLIAIAGIITPLGLYSVVSTGKAVTPAFEFVNDTSPFGFATPPRSDGGYSRFCSSGNGAFSTKAPCPYTPDVVIVNETWVEYPYNMTTAIPEIIREIYSSGTAGFPSTISNYWDIEWRQYSKEVKTAFNNGTEYLVGRYRQMASLILRDEIVPVEGLLVDTIDGGLGFRNHTIPTNAGKGGSWEEDILFIQPATACVDTNLSMSFTVSNNGTGKIGENVRLVDRGGFAKLNQTYPMYDHDNAQSNPDLEARAYKAAWLNNAMTALFLNVTNPNNETANIESFSYLNSNVGKEFPLDVTTGTMFDALEVGDNYGNYLNENMETNSDSGNTRYPNPFEITVKNFTTINLICRGAGSTDIANISNILMGCGMMRGAAVRTDGGSSLLFEGGSQWSAPLYSCATTVKATIRTVSFLLNGTSELASLSVTGTRPKTYANNDSLPLWGLEASGKTNDEIDPIWGLISPAYENYPNISVVRAESLHLSGYAGVGFGPSIQNLPGTDFPAAALASAYDIGGLLTSTPKIDYTGYSNMPMYVKWQDLSRNASAASKIVNLIWTDLAAAAVVGTKSALGSRDGASGPVKIVVRPLVSQIKYHWLFGIPAFLVLLLCLLIGTFALVVCVFHRHNFAKLRKHLQQTAAGRILTAFIYPEYTNLNTSTHVWSQSVGRNVVDLSGDNPLMTLLAKNNFHKGGMPIPDIGSPREKGAIGHSRELSEADERLVPSRVPSPYDGGNGHGQSFPLTNMPSPKHHGFSG